MSHQDLAHFEGLVRRILDADVWFANAYGAGKLVHHVVVGRSVWDCLLEERHPDLDLDVEPRRRRGDAELKAVAQLPGGRRVGIYLARR